MMYQSSNRKNRNKKSDLSIQEHSDTNQANNFIPQIVKKPVYILLSLLPFGLVLLIWRKVFCTLRTVKNKAHGKYSQLMQFRMVSEDYHNNKAMTSKSSSPMPKPTSTLQPTRLEVDSEVILKYKKKLEKLTEEECQEEFIIEKKKGNDCFNKSLYAEAMKHYTFCIMSQPYSVVGYTNRAAAYLKMNKYSQVLEDCNEALRLDPNHTKAKYRRGLALHHKNFFREALQDFEDVVRSERNNEASKSSATAKHYVAKIRELLYTQPREVRLLVNDINGNTGSGEEGDNTEPCIIQVSEKEYRHNAKYQRCVLINEWGFPKSWCRCHNGEPEFVRKFNREFLAKRTIPSKATAGSSEKISYKSPYEKSDIVLPKSCADQSVNILAKGFMRSLSSEKSTGDQSNTRRSVQETSQMKKENIEESNDSKHQVPIRNMPLLDDYDDDSEKQETGVSNTSKTNESVSTSNTNTAGNSIKIETASENTLDSDEVLDDSNLQLESSSFPARVIESGDSHVISAIIHQVPSSGDNSNHVYLKNTNETIPNEETKDITNNDTLEDDSLSSSGNSLVSTEKRVYFSDVSDKRRVRRVNDKRIIRRIRQEMEESNVTSWQSQAVEVVNEIVKSKESECLSNEPNGVPPEVEPELTEESGPKKPARKYVKIANENKTKAQLDTDEHSKMNGHCEPKVNGYLASDSNDNIINGTSDSTETKTLTKASKRHMRRTHSKLNKQSQKKEEKLVS